LRILLASHVFPPSIGGIETVSRLLAEQWNRMGHEVTVATTTASPAPDVSGYRVIRQPGAASMFGLVKWADVVFQNNVSLRTAWPLAFIHRPWFVTTAIWLKTADRRGGLAVRMKSLALKRAKNIYISRTVAAHVGLPGAIIPNPYDDATFRPFADIPRDLDLVFVGRLVSDKGVDILLHALAKLRSRGVKPNATIIGTGSEETGLRDMTRRLELTEQVVFAGTQRGNDLSRMIARHRIMVVPSRWAEPFGVVALEGIACGCAVVGSNEGGLPEAIGPCGVTFPNGSADSLADAIDGLLRDARQLAAMREAATAHLAKHAPDAIARLYLEAFLKARPACRP